MKTSIAVVACCALAALSLSYAQTSAPPDAANPPARAAAHDTADAGAAKRMPVAGGSDPRVCLEFATNLEVHMCAEKYRPRRRG
jgi:hypothetical protein